MGDGANWVQRGAGVEAECGAGVYVDVCTCFMEGGCMVLSRVVWGVRMCGRRGVGV